MKILVIGVTGFAGHHPCKRLTGEGFALRAMVGIAKALTNYNNGKLS
ncbi:MAG: hypothetical protein WBD99_07450 [Thermodesulfobacteriota bacterium]